MSENKFSFLKERSPAVETKDSTNLGAQESPSSKSEQLEQYGRRASSRYAQINANVPAELRRAFKAKLAQEDRTMQEVVEELIRNYLED